MEKTTYNFGKAFTNARNARLEFEVVLNELQGDRKAKPHIKDWVRMLKRIEVDFKQLIGNEAYTNIIEQQLLNDEWSGQIASITDYMLELPKGIRDQIESYIENMHKVYAVK